MVVIKFKDANMSDAINYIVVLNAKKKWSVKKEGSRCATATFDTQEEAMAKAKELASSSGGEAKLSE